MTAMFSTLNNDPVNSSLMGVSVHTSINLFALV